MRRNSLVLGTGILAALVFAVVTPAGAADDLVIPIPESVVRAPPSLQQVASQDVPADLVGEECEVTLNAANNDSVHEGNNLIVLTGGESVTFENVESEAFEETTATGEVVLGETVVVQLQLGGDGVSSGGLVLTFDCSEEATTTTAAPTTTVASTTTEVPAEVLAETEVAPTESGTAAQPSTAAKLAVTG